MNRALAPADIPHYDPPLGQMGMAEGEPAPVPPLPAGNSPPGPGHRPCADGTPPPRILAEIPHRPVAPPVPPWPATKSEPLPGADHDHESVTLMRAIQDDAQQPAANETG